VRNLRLLAGLWAAGVLLRAGFLVMPHMDSDQAIFGLQAMHVLAGEYPAFSWGTAYIGTAPAFLTAVVFFLFGASRFTLDIVPTIETAVWLPLVYLLGARLGGRAAGLAAMGLSALSPGYLTIHGAWARHGYMETVLLGTVLYLASDRWWRKRAGSVAGPRHVFVLGFLAGLAWWTNFLSVYFLAPLGLAVAAGLRGAAGGTIRFAAAGAVLGSLPFWIVNLPAGFPSFAMFGSGQPGGALRNIVDLWATGIPSLLALPIEKGGVWKGLAWLVYAVFLVFLFRGVVRSLGRSSEEFVGTRFLGPALALSLAVFPIVYAFSSFGRAISDLGTLRYLLPIYVLLYPFVALGVTAGFRRPAIGALVLMPVAAFAVISDVREYSWFWKGDDYTNFVAERRRDEGLFAALEARGIDKVHVLDYWQAARLTFDAGEKIVFSETGRSRYPGYTLAVSNSDGPAYLLESDMGFEAQVGAAGGSVVRERVEGFDLYRGFRGPAGAARSLAPSGWRGADGGAAAAFDRRSETRWTAAANVRPLEIDLGRTEENVCGIAFFPGTDLSLHPRSVRVFVSPDGKSWRKTLDLPSVFGGFRWDARGRPVLDGAGFFVHRFAPMPARRVRVESDGSEGGGRWAVSEFFVLARSAVDETTPVHDILAEGAVLLRNEQWAEAWRRFALAGRAAPHSPDVGLGKVTALAYARIPDSSGRARAEALRTSGFVEEAALEFGRLTRDENSRRGGDFVRVRDEYIRRERHDLADAVERDKEKSLAPLGPGALFGTCFRLEGVKLGSAEVPRGGDLSVEYQWSLRCDARNDLGVFVHFDGPAEKRFQDDHVPLDGAYPLDRWPIGEVIREKRTVRVPKDVPSGEYRVFVGVVDRRFLNRRLHVVEPDGIVESDRFLAAKVTVR
jgi:hypothetical protein